MQSPGQQKLFKKVVNDTFAQGNLKTKMDTQKQILLPTTLAGLLVIILPAFLTHLEEGEIPILKPAEESSTPLIENGNDINLEGSGSSNIEQGDFNVEVNNIPPESPPKSSFAFEDSSLNSLLESVEKDISTVKTSYSGVEPSKSNEMAQSSGNDTSAKQESFRKSEEDGSSNITVSGENNTVINGSGNSINNTNGDNNSINVETLNQMQETQNRNINIEGGSYIENSGSGDSTNCSDSIGCGTNGSFDIDIPSTKD